MPPLDSIKDALAPKHWNQARRHFFARLLVALLTGQTCCLARLASLFPSEAQVASRYQRIRRFFGGFDFDARDLTAIVLSLAQKAGAKAPFVLAFDRTEWHLGKRAVNVFLLGIVCGRVVFPLVWTLLDKKGSSDADERIVLLKQGVAVLGKERIAFVVGDREFLCTELLSWLRTEGIGFRLRVRQDFLMTDGRGEQVRAEWLFRRGAWSKESSLPGQRRCLGQDVFVSGMRFKNEAGEAEMLIVVSDVPAPLSDYALRWSIENLFSGLKSRGFEWEATHLLDSGRLSRLISVLALVFCWCVAVGEAEMTERKAQGKTVMKKGLGRLAMSAFRRGLDKLRSLLAPLSGHFNQANLGEVLQFLYGT